MTLTNENNIYLNRSLSGLISLKKISFSNKHYKTDYRRPTAFTPNMQLLCSKTKTVIVYHLCNIVKYLFQHWKSSGSQSKVSYKQTSFKNKEMNELTNEWMKEKITSEANTDELKEAEKAEMEEGVQTQDVKIPSEYRNCHDLFKLLLIDNKIHTFTW